MSKKFRLWGGPNCGEIISGYCHYDEYLKVPLRYQLQATARVGHSTEAFVEEIFIPYSRYKMARGLRDSLGNDVYLYDEGSISENLEKRIHDAYRDFQMDNYSHAPRAFTVPHFVWRDYISNRRDIIADARSSHELDGIIEFRGMRVIWGDELKMLNDVPGDRHSRRVSMARMPCPTMAEGLRARGYASPEQSTSDDTVDAMNLVLHTLNLPTLRPYQESLLEQIAQRGDNHPAIEFHFPGRRGGRTNLHDSLVAQIDALLNRTPNPTTTARRNRTTIHSNEGPRSLFRLVYENGPKLTPERKERLHNQYLQALKNNHMQYVENYDRL